ncbi:hypothetical protein B0H14DRAFT_185032 [Mycena olivaceomarginata]|nr:hypothetical protein B0H14DRAFT_185032 [Mycena olivaceomarginata]
MRRSGPGKSRSQTQPAIQVHSSHSLPALCLTLGGISAVNDLTEDELVGLLTSHAALENYSRRPDCFRRVAANIRLRCGELDMHEDERVRAAISMTLCELATATHHSLPLECVSFTVDSDASSAQIQGECVDALSRSAQFWSSYSGYLREVRKYISLPLYLPLTFSSPTLLCLSALERHR